MLRFRILKAMICCPAHASLLQRA